MSQPDPQQHPTAKKRRKWPWIAGGIIVGLLALSVIANSGSTPATSASTSAAAGAPGASAAQPAEDPGFGDDTVVYEVTGSGKAASVFYTTNGGGSEQTSNAKLPFRKEITWPGGVGAFDYLSMTVSNGQNGGSITCRILLNGEEVGKSTSSGAFATASCTGHQQG